ncbi:DUF1489 family protein [Sphingomonas sp. MAH-20]|uniref:DUF1489 family protein n=1 Tax=Sphingomonas horti TaxID=2682842 RepID=A0A6I4IXZ8_9SPHN|nr:MULTISPECIES: DUF1489 family protein [Sphingomonas]MBA2921033.1 DUF1489 family protein [Sphingomonas sp. CGMCC 1.13658]MVO76977.1 DUF1489 family protein [Sphingomonas horti]
MLHLSKVAVGCATAEALRLRVAARADGGIVRITTRYRPTRHAELIGGSLYWIIKHRLAGRQEILRFAESEDRRCLIELDARLIPVHPHPRKAHQGWRYFGAPPPDFGTAEAADLPPRLMEELTGLGLI